MKSIYKSTDFAALFKRLLENPDAEVKDTKCRFERVETDRPQITQAGLATSLPVN